MYPASCEAVLPHSDSLHKAGPPSKLTQREPVEARMWALAIVVEPPAGHEISLRMLEVACNL